MICSARDQVWIYWVASLTHFSFFSILSEPKFTQVSAWLRERRPIPPPAPGVDPDLSLSNTVILFSLPRIGLQMGRYPILANVTWDEVYLGLQRNVFSLHRRHWKKWSLFSLGRFPCPILKPGAATAILLTTWGWNQQRGGQSKKKKIMEKSSLDPGKLNLETPF